MSELGISLEEALQSHWKSQQEQGKAQAIWRLPHSDQFHLVQSDGQGRKVSISDIENLGNGFVAASFAGAVHFIDSAKHFFGTIPIGDCPVFNNQVEVSNASKPYFIEWVAKSIEAIQQGHFQKVVLSRTDETLLPAFDLYEAFLKLAKAYPNAFVSAFFIPEQGAIWLCATPEVLVQQNAEGIFKTVSLAGTQTALDPQGNPISPQQASWTQKEIEEQAFVSRYIIECFKRIRLREYVENGPKTVLAGNLMHLKSEFLVDTKTLGVAHLATNMLEMLHPTSAVCGTPKVEAMGWIAQAEKHDREMYAGFLGPIGFEQSVNIFVNLRTVKIKNQQATFYAGCGITEDSIPEKEWEETSMKCRTLKGILMSS
ncbi:MAG: Isochorismate synthase [Bacteroidota bacterium]